ncbi:uncharacterized protein LOC127838664 isoform X2 [Dreissena polymorpha]|nr:uncharacterized protein LOC127838664 isoform X2 [Dreissena polymorpha]
MAGRLLWLCVLMLDIWVNGQPLNWNRRPSDYPRTVNLSQLEPCFNSIAAMNVNNGEGNYVYSLVDQKPDGKFYQKDPSRYRVYCNESALRSNGHSIYILNVSVTDGVTYLNDNFNVTVIGFTISTTGAKTLPTGVQSNSSLTVTSTDGRTNSSQWSSYVSVPMSAKTSTTESEVTTTGSITVTGGVLQEYGVNTTYLYTEMTTDGGLHGSKFSSSVTLPITFKSKSSSTDVGLIVGIVVGVVGLTLIAIAIYVVWKKRGKKKIQISATTGPKHSVEFTNFEYKHLDRDGGYIGAGGDVRVSIGGSPSTAGDSKVPVNE